MNQNYHINHKSDYITLNSTSWFILRTLQSPKNSCLTVYKSSKELHQDMSKKNLGDKEPITHEDVISALKSLMKQGLVSFECEEDENDEKQRKYALLWKAYTILPDKV